MKQNKGIKKKKWPWILAGVLCICIAAFAYVLSDPNILPGDLAQQVHKFKQNVGLEEKYNGNKYETIEGGGDRVFISDDKVSYIAPEKDRSEFGIEDVKYVNNALTVDSVELLEDVEVERLLSKYGAKVVGYDRRYNRYTVKLPKAYEINQLFSLCDDIEKIPEFDFASTLRFGGERGSYIPKDPKWNKPDDKEAEWSDVAGSSGRNWGVEAINAPALWDYKDQMEYVNVGVLDNHFFENHEDLHFTETFHNSQSFLGSTKYANTASHGTHVAGTMSAMFDNEAGIAGVAPKTRLYGASYEGVAGDSLSSAECYIELLNWLIDEKDCKVINVSFGGSYSPLATAGDTKSIESIKKDAGKIAKALQELIDKKKDFVIVKAAGNENSVSDPADAMWDAFSYIGSDGKYKDVAGRIIVVGNVEKTPKGFTMRQSSNYGERVDVVAPGQKIYSTMYKKEYWVFGKYVNDYNELGGTSMAAPHVAGVAAALYSLNPQLNGLQVKKAICGTASDSYDCKYENSKFNTKKYKLLDAGAAAQEAMKLPDKFPGGRPDESEKIKEILLMDDFDERKEVWVAEDESLKEQELVQCGIQFELDENEIPKVSFYSSMNHYQILKADKPLALDGSEFTMNVSVPEDAYGIPNPYSGELTFKIGKDSDRYFLETAPILPNGEKLDKVVRFYRNVDKVVNSREDIRNRINSITDNSCPDNFEIIWNPDFLSDNLGHCLVYIPGGLMTEYGNYEVFLVTSYGHVGGAYKLKSDIQNSAFPSVF